MTDTHGTPIGKKIVAAALATALIFTSIGESLAQSSFWADRQAAKTRGGSSEDRAAKPLASSLALPTEVLNPVLGAYRVPADLGSVIETHAAGGRALLHIQDAHGLYGAQRNASEIIEGLIRSGWWSGEARSLTVYQEGGAGPAGVDWLSAFPFEDVRQKVAQAHLRRGDLTGEEYRAILESSGTVRLIGVESEDLYRKNLAARHETAEARSAAERHIAAVQSRLETLKKTIYPVPLKKLDEPLREFSAGKMSFVLYARALVDHAMPGFSPETYPQLDALRRLTRLEATLDPRALADERALLLEQMGPRLPSADIEALTARALAFRQGRESASAFYESLLAAADRLKRSGADLPTRRLRDYVGYLKTAEGLRHDRLVAEADQLKNRLLENYAKDDRVWRLVNMDRRVALERLLWRQELTPDQYAAFRQEGALDWSQVNRYLTEHGAAAVDLDPSWTRALPQVRDYYELALERDVALVNNALADMEKTGLRRAVLVAGGFHTPGLTRLLRQSGAAYAVLQPQFSAEVPTGELVISQQPGALAHSVREANRLVYRPGDPLAQSVPGRSLIEMFAKSTEKILSVGRESAQSNEERLAAYRAELKAQGVQVALRDVVHLVDAEGRTAQTVLYGEFNGELFIIASDLKTDQVAWITEDAVRRGETARLNAKFARLIDSRPGLKALWNDLLASFKALTAARAGQRPDVAARAADLAARWGTFAASAGRFPEAARAALTAPVLPEASVEAGRNAARQARRAAALSGEKFLSASVSLWSASRKWLVGAALFLAAPAAMAAEAAGLAVGVSPAGLLTLVGGVSFLGWAGLRIQRSPRIGPRLRTLLLALAIGLPALFATSAFQSAEAAELSADGTYYTVQVRDTVWNMARQDLQAAGGFFTNADVAQRVSDYGAANPGVDLHKIVPGQTIERPALDGAPVSAPLDAPSSPVAPLSPDLPAADNAGVPEPAAVEALPEAVPANGDSAPTGPAAPPENTAISRRFSWPSVMDAGVWSKIGVAFLAFFTFPEPSAAVETVQQLGTLVPDAGMALKLSTELSATGFSLAALAESARQFFAIWIAPWAASLHQWLADASFADWTTPGFAAAGLVSIAGLWRRAPRPGNTESWAEGVAERMARELEQGPRTYPKTWNAPLRRWRRNQLSAEDKARVDAEPRPWKKWLLQNALLLKRGELPRYNTYGAHGRYISFIGLSEIKKMAARAESKDEALARLYRARSDADRQLKKMARDRRTIDDAERRQAFAKLNRARDDLDVEITARRTVLQRQFVDALDRAVAARRERVLGAPTDPMREQRDVMWRTFAGTYAYYQNRLIPEGFRLRFRSRLFLSLATVGRLVFTGIFLSQVFFFPSPVLTVGSWLVLGPLLYNISRSFVDPILIMAFMMFGPPPEGHARRDFLEVVREHAKTTGRPYAFSIEVPKMSGNPLDGYLKTDVADDFFKQAGIPIYTEAEKGSMTFSMETTPDGVSLGLQVPRQFDAESADRLVEFLKRVFRNEHKLDVEVSLGPVRGAEGEEIPGASALRVRFAPEAGRRLSRREIERLEKTLRARGVDAFLRLNETAPLAASEKSGVGVKFNLDPAAPSAELTIPRGLRGGVREAFAEFVRARLWDGFRLDVAVAFEDVRAADGTINPDVARLRITPSPGTAGRRFETRVTELLAGAKGPSQRLAADGVRVLHGEWVEIEAIEDYVSPLGEGMYPAETGEVTDAEERTWDKLGRLLEDEYGLPVSLYIDRSPNVSARFDNVDGRVVRRVSYRFSVPRENRPEIGQNLNTTQRFLDTIHLEADVWAAYRQVDIEGLRQTLRDTTGDEFTLSFAMPSNTNNAQLIQYELENLQKLQAQMDAEFPGRVSFVYFNQAMEWAAGTEPKWRDLLASADPLKAFGDRFTLFGKDGGRNYLTVQGNRVLRIRTSANGDRSLTEMSREEAAAWLKGLDRESIARAVRWSRGGWGKKLGNVAGLEWIKAGHTRPPAYSNIDAHENFTNPDAPLFPNAANLAGDILGFFRNEVLVHRVGGGTMLLQGSAEEADRVTITENGEVRVVSRAEANKALAAAIADFRTDRLTDKEGRPLEPDDLSVVMDDKNSILPGAVEAAIGVAEHPSNRGVVGFNPAIEVDPPRNTRGGLAGVYFASILLEYLDKSRLIHNKYDARFKASLFGNLSAMYGKIFKRAAYGDSFTDERITVARALSHDWQESQFSPTEAVYGDVVHTFHLMDHARVGPARDLRASRLGRVLPAISIALAAVAVAFSTLAPSLGWVPLILGAIAAVGLVLWGAEKLLSSPNVREGPVQEATQVYRMQLGDRHELLRLRITPAEEQRPESAGMDRGDRQMQGVAASYRNRPLNVTVERLGPDGQWATWRVFFAAESEDAKTVVSRIAAYLTNAIGVRERDLLTLAGVIDRDFRWLRGDLQMQATATSYGKDALPHAHRYHLGGIDFRLNGDPSFLIVLATLIPLWIFMDQAILTNKTLAYVLFGVTMLGVAFRGHFLYPAYYDAVSRVQVVTVSPWLANLLFAGLFVVYGVKNFFLSLLTISATTLMSLPIAVKRTRYLEKFAKVTEFYKNAPSVWVTSSATVVREMLGVKIADTWRNEISLMNLVLFSGLSFLAFGSLIYTGNIYFGAFWPLGISILLASMFTGWIVAHFAGQAYRRDDKRARTKRWLQVYGLSAAIAAAIFFAPVATFFTDLNVRSLKTPEPAEIVLKQLADPVTKPRPYTGVDISGAVALQVQRTEPIAQEAAPKILQAATNVGAGVKAEVFPGIESVRLTGRPKLDLPLPGDVRTSPYTQARFDPPEPLGMLKKPQLTEDQTKKLAYLLSQLDRMNTDTVKWENVGIYGGATALITLEPHAAVGLKVVDVAAYLKMLSTGYPWLREPMVAKYWAQTALLMDINAALGDPATNKESQVRSVKEIAQLLLWDKIKEVWEVDYTRFVQPGQTLKHPKTGAVLISEQDYRDLADKASGSMDKYEVLSTAVINLHYGLGYPLEKITPELVWRFTKLSHEIEKSWEAVVPSVDIKPVQLFPKPAAKALRILGNITFVLPVRIPFLSDAHPEMIPMVTAFYQEPGGLQEFLTQMLEHNEKNLRGPSTDDYMRTFLERIGADYIQQFSDPKAHPADPALYNLVRDRMTEDLKKFNKKPSEKDLRLAYLQTEYNLGRIAFFNRTKKESKNMAEIRTAALAVAKELAAVQSVAQNLAPGLYRTHMKMEPGVLEVEGIMLYLLQDQPERKAEYLRVFRDVLKTAESITADMARGRWKMADAYTQHVLSLLPPALVADMTPKAQEYNVLRDLAMLHLNIQKNAIAKADGKPYTYKETMDALLAVRARVAGLRVPEKPGILATMLLHSLKMKSIHPEVTDREYWDNNVLPVLRYWAAWSAQPAIFKALDADPHWVWFRDNINRQIEAEMGRPIEDPEVRQFNAVQSVAQLVDTVYFAFPNLRKAHEGKPELTARLILTLAHRSEAYAQLFGDLTKLPSSAVGFKEFFVVSGYELNGKDKPFDARAGFAREVEIFVLRPINDLWDTGLYESLPKAFVEAIHTRMKDTQEQLGIADRPIKPEELKIQVLQAFYKMAASAIVSNQYPKPLPPHSAASLAEIVAVGRELIGYSVQIAEQASGLPRVAEYVLKEPGILENEAIQIYLLKKRAGDNFNLKNYMAQTRAIFQKIDQMLKDQPGLLRSATFAQYRGIKSSLLSPQANERMTDRGRDFLALRSLANLVVNAEFNDMRPRAPLAARALSPEGWMKAYIEAWDHFENAPKYGGRKYEHVPYREEGFVDMITLLKQKWGFTKFWESYYYERLNQVERFMSNPEFVKFIRTPGGPGEKLLWVINDDIFRKSGIRFDSNHPIFTFNGVIGLTEMFIDAGKKFPGTEVNYQLLAARYLRYYDLFNVPDPATGKLRFPNLPSREEGFIESLVTGGYNFESNGGSWEDELRIMKLQDVDALMGAKFLDPEEKYQGTFVRGYLEGIIRTESSVPPGVSSPVIDFFILQKIVGIGQTYNMLTGPSAGPGQPATVNVAKDVPVLKSAARALVHVHSGVRRQSTDGKDLYPKLRPIFDILGESEKWVGRMHATGILTDEARFPEIFANYIDVLERHYDELRGTYLQPEQGPNGGRYLGELGTYLRVLKENLRKDAAAIEARFVTRQQRDRRLGQGGLEEEKDEEGGRAQVVFVRPEIDESQFILDAGYIITEILRDMDREIAAAKNPALSKVTVDRLMSHYFKTLAHLKNRHYKSEIIRVQSYRDSELLGRLNGKINNYAMRFAFIDYLVYSADADPRLSEFFRSNGLDSVEAFMDRFYGNLRVVQTTDGLRQALDELRNANEFSAEGVEFSYAMMLTLNHRITPETLGRVAARIPDVLRDYNDFLLRTRGEGAPLKFRVDSAVVLYEALARELASARPLGDTGDRMEVKQKRTNEPWMVDTLVKAVYGNLFGIYLDDDIAEHRQFLKDWEIKAFGKELKGVVRELATQPTVMGQKNAYLDEITKVDEAIKERTAKYEAAKRDLRQSLADDYEIQIRILRQIRAGLEERLGYLLQLADSMDQTYATGVREKNQAAFEILLLLGLLGFGAGVWGVARRGRLTGGDGLTGIAKLRADLLELNARRKDGLFLGNAALAVYLGLPVAYAALFGVGGMPRLFQDTQSILRQAPYQFEAPKESRGTVFSERGFAVQQSEEIRGGRPVVEHRILSGGYLVGRVELGTGYAEFMPGPVGAAGGLSFPLSPGPSLVLMGYGETVQGQNVYRYGGALSNVAYRVDEAGRLVLSGTLRDSQGVFASSNYQMAIDVAPGRTRVAVSGDFTARRSLTLSEFNVGSLNTQSYIGKPLGPPSPTDRTLSLEAQGARAGDRVYFGFDIDHKLPTTGLTSWPVRTVTLGGAAYNNTPNVRLVPQTVTITDAAGKIRRVDPVATYTLLARQSDGRDNIATANVVPGDGAPLAPNSRINVRYTVEYTPVVVQPNGAAAPAAGTPAPAKKPFSLWQTALSMAAFASAGFFGLDAAFGGTVGQIVFGGFFGLVGVWGTFFYARHIALGFAALALSPGADAFRRLNLDELADRHGLTSLSTADDLPAGVFAEIDPRTGRGEVATWLVSPWSRGDGVRRSLLALVLAHESQRHRWRNWLLTQTPLLYLLKPFQGPTFRASDPMFAVADDRDLGERLIDLTQRDERVARWVISRRGVFDGKTLEGSAGVKVIYNPGRGEGKPARYGPDPLALENLAPGRPSIPQGDYYFRGGDYPIFKGHALHVSLDARAQALTAAGRTALVSLVRDAGASHVVFRNEGVNPAASGATVPLREHNQLMPKSSLREQFGGDRLPIENAGRRSVAAVGVARVSRLLDWAAPAFVIEAPAASADTVANVAEALGALAAAFDGVKDSPVKGMAILGVQREGTVQLYVMPRRVEAEIAATLPVRRAFSGTFGALEAAGLVVLSSSELYRDVTEADWRARMELIGVGEGVADAAQRIFESELRGRPLSLVRSTALALAGLGAAWAALGPSGDLAEWTVDAVSAARENLPAVLDSAWALAQTAARTGADLFAFVSDGALKALPAGPALLMAAPVAGLGGGVLLGIPGLGAIPGAAIWSVPDVLRGLSRAGGFFAAPGAARTPKGDALIISLPNGRLTPEVGRTVLHLLQGLAARLRDEADRAPVHIELVLGETPVSAQQRERVLAAFLGLTQSGEGETAGLPKDLQDRLTVGVVDRRPEALRASLDRLSRELNMNINVISPVEEASFWFGLGVSLRLFAVRLLADLTKVDVDVVFSGPEAEALARASGLKTENGQIRFKALGRPLDILDADTRKIELFNQQA